MHSCRVWRPSAALAAVAAGLSLATLPSASLGAQMPGVPVLQNAFGNPGMAAAINIGSATDVRTVAVAGAFGMRGGNIVLSGGLGATSIKEAHTGVAGGVRASWSFLRFAGDQLGVAAFIGAGGSSKGKDTVQRSPSSIPASAEVARRDSIRRVRASGLSHAPIGVSVGWRRALGATRGISAYAAPFYVWSRGGGENSTSSEAFRWSVGMDLALSPRLGITAGAELGQKVSKTQPGPWGSAFGVGVGWAFGRR